MKLSLVVLTAGTMQGKAIPVTISQFLVGRDRQCHLRPASPVISNRHCALVTRDGKAFVRDFDSTNGTFVNDQAVKGEVELHDQDTLRIGPVGFSVRIEATAPVDQRTPPPPTKRTAETVDDEAAAALFLALQEDGPAIDRPVDSEGVPTGSTIFDAPVVPAGAATMADTPAKPEEKKPEPAKPGTGDTSSAADNILQKYMRRPRR